MLFYKLILYKFGHEITGVYSSSPSCCIFNTFYQI